MTFLLTLMIGSGPGVHATDFMFNYRACANLLMARPSAVNWTEQKPLIQADVLAVRAAAAARLATRPKHARDLPNLEDDATTDEILARANSLVRMSPEDQKFYGWRLSFDHYDELAALLGSDQLDVAVEGFRITGEAEVNAFLSKLASDPTPAFENAAQPLRERALPRPSGIVDKIRNGILDLNKRRRSRSTRARTVLFAKPISRELAEGLRSFWNSGESLPESSQFNSIIFLDPLFLKAFRDPPSMTDLADLGWNGRDLPAEFLTVRRTELMTDQLNFIGHVMGLFGAFDSVEFTKASVGVNRATLEYDMIPGWQDADRRVPTLSVILRLTQSGRDRRPRRRKAVAETETQEAWVPGVAQPAR